MSSRRATLSEIDWHQASPQYSSHLSPSPQNSIPISLPSSSPHPNPHSPHHPIDPPTPPTTSSAHSDSSSLTSDDFEDLPLPGENLDDAKSQTDYQEIGITGGFGSKAKSFRRRKNKDKRVGVGSGDKSMSSSMINAVVENPGASTSSVVRNVTGSNTSGASNANANAMSGSTILKGSKFVERTLRGKKDRTGDGESSEARLM
jgi:hypothetical protein